MPFHRMMKKDSRRMLASSDATWGEGIYARGHRLGTVEGGKKGLERWLTLYAKSSSWSLFLDEPRCPPGGSRPRFSSSCTPSASMDKGLETSPSWFSSLPPSNDDEEEDVFGSLSPIIFSEVPNLPEIKPSTFTSSVMLITMSLTANTAILSTRFEWQLQEPWSTWISIPVQITTQQGQHVSTRSFRGDLLLAKSRAVSRGAQVGRHKR